MMKCKRSKLLTSALLSAAVGVASLSVALACTRALYTAEDGMVITGRTMDWKEDMRSNLWVLPRGIERNGSAGANSIAWVSRYGSVVATGYDIATADGMNEQGLVANLLFLAESDYGKREADKPALSISLWAQYLLDNFATVDEAVTALRKNPFQVVTADLPMQEGGSANLHLSISDSSGDSAVFEYIDGKLVIHHGKQYKVLTNSPTYDQADRYARASFLLDAIPKKAHPAYIKAVPDQSFANQAVASVAGVMRSVSVPLGITTPKQPNISSTLWRVVADQKNRVYYFDSATTMNALWVPLSRLDFRPGAPAMKLTLAGGQIYSGDTASQFVPAAPFRFQPVR